MAIAGGALLPLAWGWSASRSASITDVNRRCPHWAVLLPLLLVDAWLVRRGVVRWRRRRRAGCCAKCGYNLTGNVSGRCPECGSWNSFREAVQEAAPRSGPRTARAEEEPQSVPLESIPTREGLRLDAGIEECNRVLCPLVRECIEFLEGCIRRAKLSPDEIDRVLVRAVK